MKTNKKSVRKSQKGKWGSVGAPPKKTNWPNRPFTYKQLFANNTGQCELSLRNKVSKSTKDVVCGLKGGQSEAGQCDFIPALLQLQSVKQPGQKAGRPSERFVVKEHYDGSKMTLFTSAPAATVTAPKAKTKKSKKTIPIAVTETMAPVEIPVTAAVVVEVPASPVVESVARVEIPETQVPVVEVKVQADTAVNGQ